MNAHPKRVREGNTGLAARTAANDGRLSEASLEAVAGGGSAFGYLLPYIEQDNVYRPTGSSSSFTPPLGTNRGD